jgi:hypothetical protein
MLRGEIMKRLLEGVANAIDYTTAQPKLKKARTLKKPKALPQGISAAASYQDFFPIPGMTNQNDDAVGEGNINGMQAL